MESPFGNKLRVRVNGILVQQSSILLVNILSPTREKPFWTPPGGGVEFGETMESALEREFIEETGIQIKAEKLLYVSEYVKPPWHAVELFFLCKQEGGSLITGSDPELSETQQMIMDVQFLPIKDLHQIDLIPQFLQKELLNPDSNTPKWMR